MFYFHIKFLHIKCRMDPSCMIFISFNESQLTGSKVVTDEGKWWTWNHKWNAENKNNKLILITSFHQMKIKSAWTCSMYGINKKRVQNFNWEPQDHLGGLHCRCDLQIPTLLACDSKPKLRWKNVVLLLNLRFNSEHWSMLAQAYSAQSTYQ
jgi:hypothetical protein